jgi:mono/diheme cytochrome c family protein
LNYPVWEVPFGGGLLVALVATIHVFVAHFAVGGGLFLVVTEARARRAGDEALLGWVRRHTRFFARLTLVLGALTGVAIWFVIGVVHPAATSALVHVFVWVWAIEWVLFFVEIAAALAYDASWDRVDARTHLALGWIYFAASWLSLAAINGILSFMLTPGAWLASRAVGDAFWNPGYWPSLAVRTLAAVAFAGLWVFATAWREPPPLRARLARTAAWWALPATLVGPLAAALWFRAAPGTADLLLGSGSGPDHLARSATAFRVVIGAAVLYGILVLLLAWLAPRRPRLVSLPAGLALLALGYASIAGAEWVREGARKPWILGGPRGGYLWVNGLTPQEVETTRREGLLAHARFAGGRDGAPRDDRERGREIFRLACRGCHTEDGYGAVRPFVDGRGVPAIETQIRTLEQRRRMPPFPGSDAEVRPLALFLASLDGVVEPEGAPVGDEFLEIGRRKMESFCLSCHKLDGPPGANPLRPRLRGWTQEEAYRNIGRLRQMNAQMILEFQGTEVERQALAAWLARMGAE